MRPAIGAVLVTLAALGIGAAQPAVAADADPNPAVTPSVIEVHTAKYTLEGHIGGVKYARVNGDGKAICPASHPWLLNEKKSAWYALPYGVGEVSNAGFLYMVPWMDHFVGPDRRVIGIANAKVENWDTRAHTGYLVLHCTSDVNRSYTWWL